MSRNGRRVAFATWIDGKNVVVVDGRQGAPFDSVSWPLALSDGGEVVAYAARLGSDQFCIAGDRRIGPYRNVGTPVVSADGRVVAFPASDGTGWFAVKDGRPGPRFEWVGHLALSPGGDRLASIASLRDADGRAGSCVVVEETAGPVFDRVTPPTFSGDGRVIAYGARTAGRSFLVVGDRRIPVEDEIARVFLNQDGTRAGYVVEESGKARVVGPAGAGPDFDWVGWPAFTPDGRVVFLAGRGATAFLGLQDRAVELGPWIVWDLVVGPDGSQVGFGARIGRGLYWKVRSLPPAAEEISIIQEGKP